MRLAGFDFLTSSPQNFIFNRRSNKSSFGGVLSLIDVLLFLSIAIFYLFSYLNKDSYSIQYLFQEKGLTNEEIRAKINNERFNPHFNICSSLTIDADNETKSRFQMRRYNGLIFFSEVDLPSCQNMKVSDLNWVLTYDCFNETECEIDPNKIESPTKSINFNMYYNGFFLDHQNKKAPLYKNETVTHSLISNFDVFNPSRRVHTWNTVRYKEEKELFSFLGNKEDDDYIGLTLKSFDYSEMSGLKGDKKIYVKAYDFKSGKLHNYKVLGRIMFEVDFVHYDEYKRIPKSFLDTIANICSLSITLLNGLSFTLVNFFGNNFDNYKIMESILNNNNKLNKNENKENNNIDINGGLIPNESNENKNALIINDEDNNEGNNDNDNNNLNNDHENNLPDLNFFDFLFNAIYDDRCKCCKKDIKKLIQKCNEIIAKYYSIENIIYNQIKIENLMKDYRWNDPRLNNLDNNELITQLKNITSSFR